MFVSQLYTGSISDEQIVTRSGFRELLSSKKELSEVEDGDSIMAVKGFNDIEEDLKKIRLKLNSPPFLKQKPQFYENEVIRTQLLQTQDSCGKSYIIANIMNFHFATCGHHLAAKLPHSEKHFRLSHPSKRRWFFYVPTY